MERAMERPDLRIVALEIRWKWATLVDQRLAKMGISDRARVYAEDARLVLPRIQPDNCLEAVYIHFPDPWWKKRQAKRLVVAPSFIIEVIRLLRKDGMLFVQTDVEDRAEGYETLLDAQPGLIRDGDVAGSARIAKCPWTAQSNREKRAAVDQIPVNRLRYRKA
jgi:tRNA (guanine-N7-)-methyltransferase